MKRNLVKVIAVTMLAGSLVSGVTGCTSADSSNSNETEKSVPYQEVTSQVPQEGGNKEPATVTFWMASASEERNAFMEELFQKFNEENPNIAVEYLGVPGDIAQFNQKIDMAINGNEAPDIIQGTLTASYITRGILEPIDDYYNSSDIKDTIDDKYIEGFKNADYKEGKMYAVPGPMNIQMVFSRPDYIGVAGLDGIGNWNDFFTVAEKTTKPEEGIYGYIIRGGSGGAEALEKLMYSYSGITEYFADGVCTINDPKNIEFVERYLGGYKKLSSADDLNKSWTEMSSQFQSGKATMLVHNTGSGKANFEAFGNDEKKVTANPYPASMFTGKITVPDATLNGYMMTADSKNKEAAWKVIEYLESPEVAGAYAQLTGQIPVPTEAQSQPWIQESPYMKVASNYINSPDTVMTHVPTYLPNYSRIQSDYAQAAIQEVMLGSRSAQELLDEWAELLQEDYDGLVK